MLRHGHRLLKERGHSSVNSQVEAGLICRADSVVVAVVVVHMFTVHLHAFVAAVGHGDGVDGLVAVALALAV